MRFESRTRGAYGGGERTQALQDYSRQSRRDGGRVSGGGGGGREGGQLRRAAK